MEVYVFVTPDGFGYKDDLSYSIDLCLAFNLLAKANKSRKRKS